MQRSKLEDLEDSHVRFEEDMLLGRGTKEGVRAAQVSLVKQKYMIS